MVTCKTKTITKAMTEEIVKGQVQKMNELIKSTVIEIEQKPERDHDFSFLEVST